MNTFRPVVYVVDDDQSFLTSVVRLFRASGFSAEAFSSSAEFLAQRATDSPGCVVADLHMPGLNGIELQAALAKTHHPLPIIFLTGRGDIPSSVTAMRRGAEDFLTKLAPKEELLAAVRRAIERDERERQERARRRELEARFDTLTPREHEVLTQVLGGRLNKQIAADLDIDERSVKRHRASVMSKLQVQSVAELSHLAHEAGMASPTWLIAAAASAVPRIAPSPRP